MWQTVDEAETSGVSGCVDPKEVSTYHTPNSFLVDAELCRDSSCGVEHVYPTDIVFSIHKKDAAEGEVTVLKRHLGEVDRRHAADAESGHKREHCWSAMQKLMSEKYGTYLDPDELDGLRDAIKQLKAIAPNATYKNDAEIIGRIFMHLLFDRTYFEAARRWDVFVGTSFSPPAEVSTATSDAPKPPHPLRQANQELYATNKKLANENASAEGKLQRMKATLSALTSKIETKLEAPQGPGDLMQRLSAAVVALLQHSAKGRLDAESTTQDDAVHPEVAMLTEQLKKLEQSNESLQDELSELRKQQAAARQKKKAA